LYPLLLYFLGLLFPPFFSLQISYVSHKTCLSLFNLKPYLLLFFLIILPHLYFLPLYNQNCSVAHIFFSLFTCPQSSFIACTLAWLIDCQIIFVCLLCLFFGGCLFLFTQLSLFLFLLSSSTQYKQDLFY
jgi:hypothetical protein